MSEPHFNGPLAHLVYDVLRVAPDPWSAEVDAAVRAPDATPLCTNCLFPQERHRWSCPHCGSWTSDFVPVMPYLQVFLVGEILRNGVIGPPERRPGVQAFLVIYSLSQYTLFAPVYWYWMLRRSEGRPICEEIRREIPEEARGGSDQNL